MKEYIGMEAQLLEKPTGHTSKDHPLTVGNWYRILDFDGSNAITTSDEEGAKASYWRGRLDLQNCRKPN